MITNLCAALETYQIVIIVVAVVVVFAIIVALASRKKQSKNTDEKVLESRADVNSNVQAIEVLFVYAKDNPELLNQLSALQDKLKYLTPSHLNEVASIDEKIYNLLGDLKIELSKVKDDKKNVKAQKYLEQIDILIAERSAYTER